MLEHVNRHQCQRCGKSLNQYNTDGICYACQSQLIDLKLKTCKFEDLKKSEYFGYSDWRFKEREAAIGYIGTKQENGQEVVFGSLTGSQRIPLPTHSYDDMGPGSVGAIKLEGRVYVSDIKRGKKHPSVTLHAQGSMSSYKILIQRIGPVYPESTT